MSTSPVLGTRPARTVGKEKAQFAALAASGSLLNMAMVGSPSKYAASRLGYDEDARDDVMTP